MLIDGERLADRATERVLDYYAAFNRGDQAAMLALLDAEVVHDINQGAREQGVEAFARFLERMARCYREQILDLVVMSTEDGCHAAAEYVVTGEYLADDEGLPPARGQSYRLAGGAFFALSEGRITRVSNYYNLGEWTAQVSAPPAP